MLVFFLPLIQLSLRFVYIKDGLAYIYVQIKLGYINLFLLTDRTVGFYVSQINPTSNKQILFDNQAQIARFVRI